MNPLQLSHSILRILLFEYGTCTNRISIIVGLQGRSCRVDLNENAVAEPPKVYRD